MQQKHENINPSRNYYQEKSLALDSWFRIASIDYEEIVNNHQFLKIINSFGDSTINLLDIGCGTGKFPTLLDKAIENNVKFLSDLFDVSEYCVNQCRAVFNQLKHFQTNELFVSSTENIQTAIPKSRYYNIIWAIHSFYTVDMNKIKDVLRHLELLIGPGGILLIYQASSDSCYHQFYNFYLDNFEQPNRFARFVTAEDIQKTLSLLGLSHSSIDFDFSHKIDYEDRDLLEVYLGKCILNSSVDVLSFFKNKILDYLDLDRNQFSFKQKTRLIIVKKQ